MKVRYCAAVLLLAGCGGDGAIPTPTPVVTPAATSVPTPTPTPTSTNFQAAFDFTRDRTFTGLVTARTTQTVPARVVYGDLDSGALAYTAATQAIAAFGMMIVPGAMSATLVRSGESLIYAYAIATSPATLTVSRGSADVTYVGYVRDDEQVKPVGIVNLALFGAPTPASDLVARATTYRATVALIGSAAAGQTLVVDPATRRLSGTLTITLTGGTTITVTFQGGIDPQTGRLDGTATTADGGYVGAFHGRTYGPTGVEIGLIFDLIDRSGNDLPGIVLGRSG